MKVLVLGGTGAIGLHLVQLLQEKGIAVFVTSRKYRKSDNNLQYIQGDAHNIEFLKNILESNQWEAVVDFMIYNTQSFKERKDLLLNNTKQYVFLSTARVYADSEQPITENFPRLLDVSNDASYIATDEYALTKARQENALINSGKKNWTIIRPYITYSENRLQLGVFEKEIWLYRALHGRTVVFSNNIGSKITTLTYGLDVSKGISAIIGNTKALGEVFHITAKDSRTWNDILNIYLDVLEKHLGYKPKCLLKELNQFIGLRKSISKYQVLYDRLFNRQFDNSKIAQYIDTNNFMNIDEGFRKCLEFFFKNPSFNQINWGEQGKMDKMCNEITPLSEIQGIKQKIKYLVHRHL
jgi:nucleoside-diphosphate-sugar epimerase